MRKKLKIKNLVKNKSINEMTILKMYEGYKRLQYEQ